MEADSWLLTWTTYGTWLPGDERGFVGNVVEETANDAIQAADVVIGVGRTDWIRFPLPPNRTGGFPASGSPVDGFTLEWVDLPDHGLSSG